MLAVQEGTITITEAKTALDEFQSCGRHHKVSSEAISSAMLDFESGKQKHENAIANSLAKRLEKLAMFDQWTTGNITGLRTIAIA